MQFYERDREIRKKSENAHENWEKAIVTYFDNKKTYSWLSLSRARKGLETLFEIERFRYIERKIDYSLHKGAETLVRHRERFEIEGVRDRESQL